MEKKHIEALFFVAKEPLTIDEIVKLLSKNEEETIDEGTVLRWVFELQNEYKERGIRIRQVAGGFEMTTADESFYIVEKLLPKQYDRLPKSAFETIAAVLVNQPASRATIAKFRGVKNPDDAIEKVLTRKLIASTEEGYVTTDEFLKAFGINDLKQLKELKNELKALDKTLLTLTEDELIEVEEVKNTLEELSIELSEETVEELSAELNENNEVKSDN